MKIRDRSSNSRLTDAGARSVSCFVLVASRLVLNLSKDGLHGAQVDETRARVLLAEGRVIEAEKTARRAVRTLETGDAAYLLAEALTTHATSLARLRRSVEARRAFERPISVAEIAGDTHSPGLAALRLVEELDGELTNK